MIFPDDVQAISMLLADLLQLLLDGVAMDPTVTGSRQFCCKRNLIRPKVDVNKQKTRSGETKALTFSSVKLRLKIGDLTFFGRKSLLQLLVLGTNSSSFGLHKLRPVRRQGATPKIEGKRCTLRNKSQSDPSTKSQFGTWGLGSTGAQ